MKPRRTVCRTRLWSCPEVHHEGRHLPARRDDGYDGANEHQISFRFDTIPGGRDGRGGSRVARG